MRCYGDYSSNSQLVNMKSLSATSLLKQKNVASPVEHTVPSCEMVVSIKTKLRLTSFTRARTSIFISFPVGTGFLYLIFRLVVIPEVWNLRDMSQPALSSINVA